MYDKTQTINSWHKNTNSHRQEKCSVLLVIKRMQIIIGLQVLPRQLAEILIKIIELIRMQENW